MDNYTQVESLQVATALYVFVNSEVLPGTKVNQSSFWKEFDRLVTDFVDENKELLTERERLQDQVNIWHKDYKVSYSLEEYKEFLEKIGYLEPIVEDFQINTQYVDHEITVAGPQLVVPMNNARYAINAANARWGSLYDALYGTDVITEENGAEITKDFNPARGERVVSYAKAFLNQVVPLKSGMHREVKSYSVHDGKLIVELVGGEKTELRDAEKFVAYRNGEKELSSVLFINNGLHIDVQIDRTHPIGQADAAGVKDVIMEAALTTIMDCEDSVAAVDTEDKLVVYRNWLGLMKGDLTATFEKDGKVVNRTLDSDRIYQTLNGQRLTLRGRSLMFVRNVGHLMTSDAVLLKSGEEIPEGILDGVLTSIIAMHDLIDSENTYTNSKEKSVYIVKPKMHGSKEVAFTNKLFNRLEDMLGLKRHTLKIGVMDEERRTSLNLTACIQEVKGRIAFINTGFLDRTGDEIHTSMEAGSMVKKNDMKAANWLSNYEKSNVSTGLRTGFQEKAQIGKGMWAMPDLMNAMLAQKGDQIKAGASTAWVPSPTAATLHALQYHWIDSTVEQRNLRKDLTDYRDGILEIPLAEANEWSTEEIQRELDNNAQSILGYVVRWVEQGIGCSKVPDINDVALMEDRATLRISSQHLTNWLHHGVCSAEQVQETLKRMAKVVDSQNAGDSAYQPMSPDYENSAGYQAAYELIFQGSEQPNGYTEPILHRKRKEFKDQRKYATKGK